MKTIRSYADNRWHEASAGFSPLYDPSTGEAIARASSAGLDFAAILERARRQGGPALRRLTYAERGEILKGMAKALRDHRDELLELSRRNNGTTASDGAFDLDGATGTLAYYGARAKALGEHNLIAEDEGVQIGKSESFWGRHALLPRPGVAVHINAFNFPAWGFAEKAACALLAGMPVITKPATATALLAERCVEIVIQRQLVPEGALQLICGGTGDLLDRLGPLDVVAFTGSADTAARLRGRPALMAANTRFNVEADSLNAAVLGPDAMPGSPTFERFIRDVAREITQKAGQKCTAVRRVLLPGPLEAQAVSELTSRLSRTLVGNPAAEGVGMGPLATAQQLEDALAGLAELHRDADLLLGTPQRIDGHGSPAGAGYFVAPTLLRAHDSRAASAIHRREVFGPVSTVLPYDGAAADAAAIVALAGGTLVTCVYSDDVDWLREFAAGCAATTGRIYLGSATSEGYGPGAALAQSQHGGPGRAGDGCELGGLAGLRLYQQRVALQGTRQQVEAILG
jgi:oxepin-CoA hydrolase/3-oxo-5,6-dehydrosuberyl-CoA semialdehyde dehydrogenase